jgi:hypothetical protein
MPQVWSAQFCPRQPRAAADIVCLQSWSPPCTLIRLVWRSPHATAQAGCRCALPAHQAVVCGLHMLLACDAAAAACCCSALQRAARNMTPSCRHTQLVAWWRQAPAAAALSGLLRSLHSAMSAWRSGDRLAPPAAAPCRSISATGGAPALGYCQYQQAIQMLTDHRSTAGRSLR